MDLRQINCLQLTHVDQADWKPRYPSHVDVQPGSSQVSANAASTSLPSLFCSLFSSFFCSFSRALACSSSYSARAFRAVRSMSKSSGRLPLVASSCRSASANENQRLGRSLDSCHRGSPGLRSSSTSIRNIVCCSPLQGRHVPSLASTVPSTPASSRVSRTAASLGLSFSFTPPFGNSHTRGSYLERTSKTSYRSQGRALAPATGSATALEATGLVGTQPATFRPEPPMYKKHSLFRFEIICKKYKLP
jgi:hypothetical protein